MDVALPLSGKRVLITRSSHQSKELAEFIAEYGGEAVEFPVIALRSPKDEQLLAKLDAALYALEQYDWLIFTSVNGVDFFFRRLHVLGIEVEKIHRARIAVIGPKTLAALEQRGFDGEILPTVYVAESLLEALLPHLNPGQKVLLPRANIARRILPFTLRAHGLEVDDVVVYENHITDENSEAIVQQLVERRIDYITFTSSSTVRNFMQILHRDMSEMSEPVKLIGQEVAIACIGHLTAETAEQHGLHVHCLAKEATIASMMAAIIEHAQQGTSDKQHGLFNN